MGVTVSDLSGVVGRSHPWLVGGAAASSAARAVTGEPFGGRSPEEFVAGVLVALEARVRRRVAAELAEQVRACPDHPLSWLPRPLCWQCGRNGMVERCRRVALGGFPPGDDGDDGGGVDAVVAELAARAADALAAPIV
ncbi:hypothetical protein [Planomonospora sp. ID82291]|uniref:hypothetical protein n=1 Tax=Planomonospora sp. ID82291 TaxID=2738136 RepID=UPI001A303374|nr:hypothetical protein [Planomonospora sp. ID82291]MBG0818275.1 hypothetical protein [Planomonospora sp. ID82291]